MVADVQDMVPDDEWLYRRVARDQHVYDGNLGRRRPASLAFVQGGRDGETSCYVASETTPDVVAGYGSEPYMVLVPVSLIREKGLAVVRSGTDDEDGRGHVDIIGRKTSSRVTALAKSAQWVEGYEPPPGDYASEKDLGLRSGEGQR